MCRNRLIASAAIGCIAALIFWALNYRPWEREVSISTTHESFTGPYVGTEILQRHRGKIVLVLALTPAPWPEEAAEISQAAKYGKIVHVAVPYNGSVLRFDIVGTTPSGEILINCESEQEAKQIIEALKL